MKKTLRQKSKSANKAPGLIIIAAIGIIQSVLPLFILFDQVSHGSIFNLEMIWAILRLPVLFLLLWGVSSILVNAAKDKKLNLPFFENFTAWKGLAILLLYPSILFWKQFSSDYHQVLDFLHPFNSLVIGHMAMTILLIGFWGPFVLYVGTRQKAKKTEVKMLQILKKNALPSILWCKFFFKDVCSDSVGKAIGYFVGASYLLFFYITIFSMLSTTTVKTSGITINAQNLDYIRASKYNSNRGNYCILKIRSKDANLQFSINSCPPCARELGAIVTVTHHPIDYQNRRLSFVECDEQNAQ
jgi:hypothetical protein